MHKIEKSAYSIVLDVISFSASVKSRDCEQNLVWLGLNSQFWRVPRPKYMMLVHENLEFWIFQIASENVASGINIAINLNTTFWNPNIHALIVVAPP